MSSEAHDGSSAREHLADIARNFRLIHSFISTITREEFATDSMRQYAVVIAFEEACEAALWVARHESGSELRSRHPNVDFRRFADAGNGFQHQSGAIDHARVWNELVTGNEIAQMEHVLEAEVPGYQRQLTRPRPST